jgi:hypothetical protein
MHHSVLGEMMTNEFSVYQFFNNDTYERVREFVSAGEAVIAFTHYSTSVGARMGMTVRVIITDGGDSTVAEWKFGEGVTYPPEWVKS